MVDHGALALNHGHGNGGFPPRGWRQAIDLAPMGWA